MGVDVIGLKSLHELQNGDIIKSFEIITTNWNGSNFYVLKSIHTD